MKPLTPEQEGIKPALTRHELSPQPHPPPPERLAYTMREAAGVIGVSYITMHRLIARGLIKSSPALRTKIIARTELERFLNS